MGKVIAFPYKHKPVDNVIPEKNIKRPKTLWEKINRKLFDRRYAIEVHLPKTYGNISPKSAYECICYISRHYTAHYGYATVFGSDCEYSQYEQYITSQNMFKPISTYTMMRDCYIKDGKLYIEISHKQYKNYKAIPRVYIEDGRIMQIGRAHV